MQHGLPTSLVLLALSILALGRQLPNSARKLHSASSSSTAGLTLAPRLLHLGGHCACCQVRHTTAGRGNKNVRAAEANEQRLTKRSRGAHAVGSAAPPLPPQLCRRIPRFTLFSGRLVGWLARRSPRLARRGATAPMPTATALLRAPAAALRRLIVLRVLPLLLARQLIAHMLAAAAAVRCPLQWRRRSKPSMVVLFTNCRGGYHSDLRRARHSLERMVEAGAPGIKCARSLQSPAEGRQLACRRQPAVSLHTSAHAHFPSPALPCPAAGDTCSASRSISTIR